jgi:hypothetical protein
MLFQAGRPHITTRDFFAFWDAVETVGAPVSEPNLGGLQRVC